MAALFLVLLLSIESFGAVVSDNDGSAFITKAEFDSLKNDFQSQIDQYNTSIDAKIDGAIAAYLAGIRTSNKDIERLMLCESKLEFPLRIYMKNSEFNVQNYDNWVWNSCWKPDYDWTFTFQRAAKYGAAHLEYSNFDENNNKLTWFFKGERSGDTYKVSGVVKDYKITLKGMFNLMNTSKTTFYNCSAGVFMDQTDKVTSESGGIDTINRTNIIADYTKYNFLLGSKIKNNKPIVEFIDAWQQTSGPNLATYNSKLYAKLTGSNLWKGLTNATNDYITGTIKYENEGITKVFNFADATSTVKTGSVVAPVTWGDECDIYVTNKDKQKQDCTEVASTSMYEDNSVVSGGTFYVRHVVDPGWCLEPENYGYTSRNWYNKSLINPKRLVYPFVTPYSDTEYASHRMIDGIPLTEIEKKKDNTKYNNLKVKFDVTKDTDMTATPSVCFFTEPNEKYKLSEITGDEFLNVSSSKDFSKKLKTVELKAGTNYVYVDPTELGSKNIPLYFKILWGNQMDKAITIEKPVLELEVLRE